MQNPIKTRKTAFITGGATGIGKETARALCSDGFFVVIFCLYGYF